MDAELLEYLETAIREAKDHLATVPDDINGVLDRLGCPAVDFAHNTLEEALTRIERAKVLGC